MFLSCRRKKRRSSDETHRRTGKISRPVNVNVNLAIIQKTDEQETVIRNAILENEFLRNVLHGKRLKTVVDTVYMKETNENESIIVEGESGTHMYISYEGIYTVSKNDEELATFSDNRVFGELSLLYNAKRLASIKSVTPGKLWVLNCNDFKALMIKTAIEEQEEIVAFLKEVPKLNTVSEDLLIRVANLFEVEFFPSDTKIVVEGEKADKFYIIRAGEVSVSKKDVGRLDTCLGRGSFFGELAILKEDVRAATITANSPGVECLTLSSQHFIDHFGDVEEFVNIKLSKVHTPTTEDKDYKYLEITDFCLVTTLGRGGYGRVELVRHNKKKDMVFALKYVRKDVVKSVSAHSHILNEKKLQMSCDSSFIVRMYRTYKDAKYVYFLLECCLGGDLWTLMRRKYPRGFNNETARFYASCVLEGLAYLHERNVVFRDLKPENIVVANDGYLKLTDFGFAKQMEAKDRSFTFVGTPEYVAPEIIKGEGHSKEIDYWAFGIFVYELLTCKTPFKAKDPTNLKTYKNILKGIDSVSFPSIIPTKAKDMIKQLCRPKPFDRLGCKRKGIDDIRNHGWFNNFEWESLKEHKMAPPFRPELNSNVDTKYFDKFRRDSSVPNDDLSDWDKDF